MKNTTCPVVNRTIHPSRKCCKHLPPSRDPKPGVTYMEDMLDISPLTVPCMLLQQGSRWTVSIQSSFLLNIQIITHC